MAASDIAHRRRILHHGGVTPLVGGGMSPASMATSMQMPAGSAMPMAATDPVALPAPTASSTAPTVAPHVGSCCGGATSGAPPVAAAATMGAMPMQHAQMQLLAAPKTAGQSGRIEFRLTGPDGKPIDEYEYAHGAPMHLFTVDDRDASRSLGDFQHLHPKYQGDGVWSVDGATLSSGGTQHLIADFSTNAMMTVAQTEMQVSGDATPKAVDTGGMSATMVGAGAATSEGPTRRIRLANADGTPVSALGSFLGSTAHLTLLAPDAADAGTLDFEHGHADVPISRDGTLDVGVGMLRPGVRYQAWLQVASPDGTIRTLPMTVTG